MNEKIKEIISEINEQKNWSLNQKIRYAYIELGKNIHLNAKFFYSLYQLLDEDTKYSVDEIREIYSNLKPSSYVICRDCAYMLKIIFDNCGINSKIIETCEVDHYTIDNTILDIQHFFVCVEGDNKKQYFLSLAIDLPYIQMNMETEHFATNIVYKNGAGQQVYQGPQIHNSVMTKQEVRKLDDSLGLMSFIIDGKKEYFNESFAMLKEANKKYKEYLSKIAMNMNNEFYKGLVELISEDSEVLSINLRTIDNNKWDEVKKYVCESVYNKLKKENVTIEPALDYILNNYLERKEYKKYLEISNKILKINKDISKNGEFSLYALVTSSSKLIDTIDRISKNQKYNSKDYQKLKTLMNLYIMKTCYPFIPKKYQPTYDNNITNEYIANKIRVLFPDIFDFGNNTTFTHLEIAEKKVIIERVINSLFPELSKDKLEFRKKENPIENRIATITFYDKKDNEYKLLLLVEATKDDNTIPFIYNFNDGKNYFEKLDESISLFDMLSNKDRYIFLSKSLEIRAQENIEGKKKR